jgi:hypothetical protein
MPVIIWFSAVDNLIYPVDILGNGGFDIEPDQGAKSICRWCRPEENPPTNLFLQASPHLIGPRIDRLASDQNTLNYIVDVNTSHVRAPNSLPGVWSSGYLRKHFAQQYQQDGVVNHAVILSTLSPDVSSE